MVVPRLSKDALRCLSETAETERAVGDPNVATAIELLLEWHDGTARRIDELLEANNRYQEEARAARREMSKVNAASARHGPYGYLVVTPGLNEEHWRLSDDPLSPEETRDGLVALPLFLHSEDGEVLCLLYPGEGGARQ